MPGRLLNHDAAINREFDNLYRLISQLQAAIADHQDSAQAHGSDGAVVGQNTLDARVPPP